MTLPCGLPSRPLADEDQEDEESSHHVEAAEAAKQDLEFFFVFFAIISVAFKRQLWLSGSVCAYHPAADSSNSFYQFFEGFILFGKI